MLYNALLLLLVLSSAVYFFCKAAAFSDTSSAKPMNQEETNNGVENEAVIHELAIALAKALRDEKLKAMDFEDDEAIENITPKGMYIKRLKYFEGREKPSSHKRPQLRAVK